MSTLRSSTVVTPRFAERISAEKKFQAPPRNGRLPSLPPLIQAAL
jgi:hypothetical protein